MKTIRKMTALTLCICLLLSVLTAHGFAAERTYGPYEYDSIANNYPLDDEVPRSTTMNGLQKAFYNGLNAAADVLLRAICAVYPSPADWKNVKEWDGAGFLPGRETYSTEAADANRWRVGYASRSIIPDDFEPGKYYIGRDLSNRLAKGILDDNRVRAAALDDGSGEGLVLFAAADALGVTRADTITVRENVLAWAKQENIRIASINLSATHSHSAIDAQGVATEAIYKLLTTGFKTVLHIQKDKKLDNAERFKEYYLNAVTAAMEDAVRDMRTGTLSYAKVDTSSHTHDKRGLIRPEDLPQAAAFRFVPDDGSAGIYIADVACHPTSFGAGNGLFSADYIAYMEQRVEEKTGCRFLFMQGASGQVSRRNVGVDESKLPEEERLGAETRYMGKVFADMILEAETEELPAVLNVRHTQFLYTPTNYLLVLAVKAQLVNDQVYTDRLGLRCHVVLEEGYVELGGRVGLCLFPVEMYPEVFIGTKTMAGGNYAGTSWDGGDWTYPVPAQLAPRGGIDMYAVHLCNDSLGYCVPDNNYAFFGHIIGDEIADEVLSLGKPTASTVVTGFQKLMDDVKQSIR